MRTILLLSISLLLGQSTFSAEPLPATKSVIYVNDKGTRHLYLVQEPAAIPGKPTIFIYMHGAGGQEEQGMDPVKGGQTFFRLRTVLAKSKWIYVCPRDPDFPGLLKELGAQYHPGAIYLAGASAGGRAVFEELMRDPAPYSGVMLLSPAVLPSRDPIKVEGWQMPVWITAGEKDGGIIDFSRRLAQDLKRAGKRHQYVEIPNGDHNSPTNRADWEKAIRFLSEIGSVDGEDVLKRAL